MYNVKCFCISFSMHDKERTKIMVATDLPEAGLRALTTSVGNEQQREGTCCQDLSWGWVRG